MNWFVVFELSISDREGNELVRKFYDTKDKAKRELDRILREEKVSLEYVECSIQEVKVRCD